MTQRQRWATGILVTVLAGWTVAAHAGGTVVNAKGGTTTCDVSDQKACPVKTAPSPLLSLAGQPTAETGKEAGMPVYSFKSMLASLTISDTPLYYVPPVGESIRFSLYYNAREASQPATFTMANLGRQWSSSWVTYIQDNPAVPGDRVMLYVAGGGSRDFTGYNSSTGGFAPETNNAALLVRVAPTRYELRHADGSVEVFAQPDSATAYPRKLLLTERIDPQGNRIALGYDGQLRLVTLADAIGQVSTFQYDNAVFPLAITGMTDPFGRTAAIEYDSLGRLVAITDAIGLRSTFTYAGTGTFINRMTTPYGSTTFSSTQGRSGSTSATVMAIDPLGHAERTEYRHNAPGIAFSESRVPAGMGLTNNYMNYRNSFYWNKTAFAEACTRTTDDASCDYTRAFLKHFLHNAKNETGRVLESIRQPLESRVWYTYQGQKSSIYEGNLDYPTSVGRVLEDGSTQRTRLSYNTRGKVVNRIDPEGRETRYVYAANGIDLLQVWQKTTQGEDALASYT